MRIQSGYITHDSPLRNRLLLLFDSIRSKLPTQLTDLNRISNFIIGSNRLQYLQFYRKSMTIPTKFVFNTIAINEY